jgi:hypothetical protein
MAKPNYQYEFYLCETSHPYTIKGCLTTCITNRVIKNELRNVDELSFTMYDKYNDGEENELFNEIEKANVVMVEKRINDVLVSTQLFHISEVNLIGDMNELKEIKAYGLEIRMNKQSVRNFKYDGCQIYTGTWDENDIENSGIVDYILSLFESNWTVNYVTPTLLNSFRDFDIPEAKVLEAIKIIEQNFNCVFIFNSHNQTIDILEYNDNYNNFGEHTGIILDKANYINQYKSQIDIDDIVTRLYVEGKKDSGIESVNILGTDYIDDFSFFMNTKYMTQGLITALQNLTTLRNSKTAEYIGLLDNLALREVELITLNSELLDLESELRILEDNQDSAIKLGTYQGKNYSQWGTDITNKNVEITNKKSAITSKQSQINGILGSIDSLQTLISYKTNLTSSQLKELTNFIQEDTQRFDSDNPNVLMTLAQSYLSLKAQTQYNIDVDLVDVFSVKSESYAWDKIVLGRRVNLITGSEVFEPLIVSLEHRIDDYGLSAVVSNKNYLNDDLNFLTAMWMKANQSAVLVDNKGGDWDGAVEKASEAEVFIKSPIDVSSNAINIEQRDEFDQLIQQAQITRRGIFMRDNKDANGQMRIFTDRILFTKTNWQPDGDYPGYSVGITSDGIQTSQDFLLRTKNEFGGQNLVKISGTGIDIHGSDTANQGIRMFNRLGTQTFGLDANGNINMTGNITMNGGSINWSAITSDPDIAIAQSTANSASSTASNAFSTASSAISLTNSIANGTYSGGSFINGRVIASGTILATSSVSEAGAGITSTDATGKHPSDGGYNAQSTDVRFWAGSSFNDRNTSNAKFKVLQSGKVVASDIDIVGGSINIGTNATVGTILTLGSGSSNGRINFKSGAIVVADVGVAGIRVSASDFNVNDGNIKLGNVGGGVSTEIVGSVKLGVSGSPATVDFTHSTIVGLQIKFS